MPFRRMEWYEGRSVLIFVIILSSLRLFLKLYETLLSSLRIEYSRYDSVQRLPFITLYILLLIWLQNACKYLHVIVVLLCSGWRMWNVMAKRVKIHKMLSQTRPNNLQNNQLIINRDHEHDFPYFHISHSPISHSPL